MYSNVRYNVRECLTGSYEQNRTECKYEDRSVLFIKKCCVRNTKKNVETAIVQERENSTGKCKVKQGEQVLTAGTTLCEVFISVLLCTPYCYATSIQY